MINAAQARATTKNAVSKAQETKVFKTAVKNLEKDITSASRRGKYQLTYNIAYFDIPHYSSLEKDEHATSADRAAIQDFMISNGYEFYFHNTVSINGTINRCFTVKW